MESEGPTAADRIMPAALTGRRLLGMSLAQWLGWLLSIPISWLLAWLLAFLLSAPARIRNKLRKLPFRTVWQTRLGMPLKCIIAILIHCLFVYLLDPPLLYRVYYISFPGNPPGGMSRVAHKHGHGPRLRTRGEPNANATQRWGVDPRSSCSDSLASCW